MLTPSIRACLENKKVGLPVLGRVINLNFHKTQMLLHPKHGGVFGGILPVGSYPGIYPTWGWHFMGCKVVRGCVVLSAVLYIVR